MSIASRELFLFGSNDGNLYRQRTMPIILNLAKKLHKGIFDKNKSLILWKYWADDAAKRYEKEFGGKFSTADRKAAATEAANYYHDEIMESYIAATFPLREKSKNKKNPLKRGKSRSTISAKKNPRKNPRKNPCAKANPIEKSYKVEYRLNNGQGWILAARFPHNETGKKAAKEYAEALYEKHDGNCAVKVDG